MFEKLLGLVGDNQEAKDLIAGYENEVTAKISEYETKVSSLTNQFETVKAEKDRYKAGNALVKQALGIDQINEETVSDRIKSLSKDDAAMELASKLSEKENLIESIKQQQQSEIANMRVGFETERVLNEVSDVLTDDPMLRDAFRRYLSEDIGVIDDKVLPVQKIGDQVIPIMNGDKPVELTDHAKSMLESDRFKSFRKTSVKNSAGKIGAGGGAAPSKNFIGKPSERRAAIEAMMNKG